MEDTTKTYWGKVKVYRQRDNYGFITRLPEEDEYYVHKSAICIHDGINVRYPKLFRGEYVQFTVDENPDLQNFKKDPDKKLLPFVKSVTGLYGKTIGCEDVSLRYQKRKQRRKEENPNEEFKNKTDNQIKDTTNNQIKE